MGVEHGLVRKAGAWYTYEGDQLGQGKENARAFLLDNPDLTDELEKRLSEKLGSGLASTHPPDGGPDRDPGTGSAGSVTGADDQRSDPREVGRLIALRQLEVKPRTEGRLHDTLCERGIPAEVAQGIIERFVEVGLLDDRMYARIWVESGSVTRPGLSTLRQELRAHKIPTTSSPRHCPKSTPTTVAAGRHRRCGDGSPAATCRCR